MQIIPAIDIKDGHCVRLKQGDMQSVTVFSEDPAAMAQHWLELGAQRLHLVDLNGAFAGKPANELAIREIVSVIGEEIPVQLGGGIRDLDTIERYLDDGISYVVIGTAAVKNPGFLHEACSAFPGHILVGLDAREGKVATDGWSKMTGPRRRRPRAQVRGVRRRRQSSTPTSAATACCRASTSRPRSSSRARSRCRSSPPAGSRRSPTSSASSRTRPTASSAPSPAARSTRARSTSRMRSRPPKGK